MESRTGGRDMKDGVTYRWKEHEGWSHVQVEGT